MAYDYGRHFGEITLTHDLTTRPGDRTWRLDPPGKAPARHQVVLYLGCNVLRTSHMIQTVMAIFDRLGLDYVAVGGPAYCCGIVHHQHGDTAAGAGMNRRTVELFQRYEPEEVVMWCLSCIYFYGASRNQRLRTPRRASMSPPSTPPRGPGEGPHPRRLTALRKGAATARPPALAGGWPG